jgi:hypothetical protein
MTKEALERALSTCVLLPQGLVRYALQASLQMDDSSREALWRSLSQEYSQYVPLVQRKVERMEHTIAEAETSRPSHSAKRPGKDVSPHAALVRQMNGMLS